MVRGQRIEHAAVARGGAKGLDHRHRTEHLVHECSELRRCLAFATLGRLQQAAEMECRGRQDRYRGKHEQGQTAVELPRQRAHRHQHHDLPCRHHQQGISDLVDTPGVTRDTGQRIADAAPRVKQQRQPLQSQEQVPGQAIHHALAGLGPGHGQHGIEQFIDGEDRDRSQRRNRHQGETRRLPPMGKQQ